MVKGREGRGMGRGGELTGGGGEGERREREEGKRERISEEKKADLKIGKLGDLSLDIVFSFSKISMSPLFSNIKY